MQIQLLVITPMCIIVLLLYYFLPHYT